MKFIADVMVEVMTFPPPGLRSLTLISVIFYFFPHLFTWLKPWQYHGGGLNMNTKNLILLLMVVRDSLSLT